MKTYIALLCLAACSAEVATQQPPQSINISIDQRTEADKQRNVNDPAWLSAAGNEQIACATQHCINATLFYCDATEADRTHPVQPQGWCAELLPQCVALSNCPGATQSAGFWCCL